jgi:hypothetical protein
MMTVGYKDGAFFREEVSHEQRQEYINEITKRIKLIRERCQIVTATRPKAGSVEYGFLEREGAHDLDPIYVSIERSAVLLSEDLRFRQLGSNIGVQASSWIQPLLLLLVGRKELAQKEYSGALVRLVARRHTYVSVRASDLLILSSEATSTPEFRCLAAVIGSPNAELRSHVRVVVEFAVELDDMMREAGSKQVRLSHFGILLEELIKLRWDDWYDILVGLKVVFVHQGRHRLAEYVEGWRRGHFLVRNGQ